MIWLLSIEFHNGPTYDVAFCHGPNRELTNFEENIHHHHLDNQNHNKTQIIHQQEHFLDYLTCLDMSQGMNAAEHSVGMHLQYISQVFSSSAFKVFPMVDSALSEDK